MSARSDGPEDRVDPEAPTVGGSDPVAYQPTTPGASGIDDHGVSTGTRVGRYLIESKLGAGGMGVVYVARDTQLGRRVALKLVRPLRSGLAAARARLEREAQAMARLSHANVVPIYDVGTHGEQIFIVMELHGGGSLREWMRRPRGWREVIEVYRAAGEGLAAAHAAGLVHRDFKPDNVLLTDGGTPRVSDFGLARSGEDGATADGEPAASSPGELQTVTGSLAGTPAYMAPEQLRGARADARSDQFALCVSMYEGLYGERPFAADQMMRLAEEIEQGRIRPAPAGSRVPRRVRAVLLRGLVAGPEARWPGVAELVAALDRAARRGPALPAAAILGGVALIGGLALYTMRGGDSNEPDLTTPPAGAAAPAGSVAAPDAGAVPAPVLRAVRLGAYTGQNRQRLAAMSPDGEQVAFSSGDAMWIAPMKRPSDRRDLALPAGLIATQLAYSPAADRLLVRGFAADGACETWHVPVDGGVAERLHRSAVEHELALAPGGERAVIEAPGRELAIIAGDGRRPVVVAADGERLVRPAWSPDGNRLSFLRHLPTSVVRVEAVDRAGGTTRVVARTGGYITDALWVTPDTVLHAEPFIGYGTLLVETRLPAAGDPVRRELHAFSDYDLVDISLARGQIFATGHSTFRRMAITPLRGARARGQVETGSPFDAPPVGWLADGRVVFSLEQNDNTDIVAQAPGRAFEVLVGAPEDDVAVTLVNGDELVFGRWTSKAGTYYLRTAGGAITRLFEVVNVGLPGLTCSHRRPSVCVQSVTHEARRRHAVVDLATGARQPELHEHPVDVGWESNAALSPDGRWLAVARPLGRAVDLVPVAGGDRRSLRPSIEGIPEFVGWEPGGRLLVVQAPAGRSQQASIVSMTTSGRSEPLLLAHHLRWRAPMISADGRYMATSRVDTTPTFFSFPGYP